MNAPTSGLRPLFNQSKSVAKVSLTVAPGDRLDVSEDVAAQLMAASTAFVGPDGAAVARAAAEAVATHRAPSAPADGTQPSQPVNPSQPTERVISRPKKKVARRSDA